jgi:dUTPase
MPPQTAPLRCKRLHADSKLPSRVGTFGLEVHAYLKSETGHPIKMVLPCGMARMVPTGIRVDPGPDLATMLLSHVNLAVRGVNVLNSVTNTSRELCVLLHNAGLATEWIEHEDPIAQLILIELPTPVVVVEDTPP